jgi:hypothetical protein
MKEERHRILEQCNVIEVEGEEKPSKKIDSWSNKKSTSKESSKLQFVKSSRKLATPKKITTITQTPM